MNLNDLIDPEKPDPESAHAQKVILWGDDNLLAQTVSSLLETRMDWNVIRVPSEGGIEALMRAVNKVSPDVVILCQEKWNSDSDLPVRLIREQVRLKVITVGLESNLMQIYSRRNVMVRGVSDLLSVFESGNFLDHSTC